MTWYEQNRWRIALALAAITAFAGILLVGLSSWFLGAVALAGLGPMAFAFNFHYPAALVRLFALTRTAGKYGERVVGHQAALHDQSSSRLGLFRRFALSRQTRERSWQLAEAHRLEAFLGDVEAFEFLRLRSRFPALILAVCTLCLTVASLIILPTVVPVLLCVGLGMFWSSRHAARLATGCSEAAKVERAEASELMGLALGSLASLAATGERAAIASQIAGHQHRSDELQVQSSRWIGQAETLLAVSGLVAATAVLVLAWLSGDRGADLLPSLMLAFAWLAFGELVVPMARQQLAGWEASAASRRINSHQGKDEISGIEGKFHAHEVHLPFEALDGSQLAEAIDLRLERGSVIGLLGPSGCGKTTALKRLAGWLPWTNSQENHPLSSEATARQFTHFSLHDGVVLTATVRENLLSSATDEELWAALKLVELDDRVREAGGLGGMITQETLSLGEARRMALARAILSEQPIVLFDEPGEHLKPEQALRIMKRVLVHLEDRAVVVVTHDQQLASLANQVVEVSSCVHA